MRWTLLAGLLVGLMPLAVLAAPPTVPGDDLPEIPMARFAEETLPGGPGKDGIPAIDEPQFVAADGAGDWLADGDIIFGVVLDGHARAYPQRVLVWHEIVNDRLAGQPVSVTYCPLTATAIGFHRGGTTLGVSGNLVNSNLVMYDRATDSRWPQILGAAVKGEHKGRRLEEFRVIWTTWARWREAHPDTDVLSTDTGYFRNYERDPYGGYNPTSGYYDGGGPAFPVMRRDERLPAKHMVMGARTQAGAVAFDKSVLRRQGLLEADVGGERFVAVYDPALDTGYVYRVPPEWTGRYEDGAVVTDDGGHAPGDLPLERVNVMDAFWFAWAAFYPDTTLVGGKSA
ncbi:DUF3179 domain-containing protein [Arhodomonas sp. AD133]|uniref:DUF3179 domain-containing protein n=1 Tax=Arhodomonas sp. AD133 TaxID=3415009 RepID=UPI003EB78616